MNRDETIITGIMDLTEATHRAHISPFFLEEVTDSSEAMWASHTLSLVFMSWSMFLCFNLLFI